MSIFRSIFRVHVACALADLGFLEGGGDFGNPSERSARALRGSGLTAEGNFDCSYRSLAIVRSL